MKKFFAIALLVGFGLALAPACKKEEKKAKPKKHYVKKHKKQANKKAGKRVHRRTKRAKVEGFITLPS